MSHYKIITLIDITKSNARRGDSDLLKLGQQSNFDTLVQTINLRANISWERDPVNDLGTLPDPFEGKAAYWTWDFYTEREDLFLEDGDPIKLLAKDLHGVPVVAGLTETIDLAPSIFNLQGEQKNTYIEII